MQLSSIVIALAVAGGLTVSVVSGVAETDARCALTLAGGGELKLGYRTRPWDAEIVRRMRSSAEERQRANQRLPLLIRGELTTPRPLRVGEVTLEAGAHRVSLGMNRAGAWELVLLKDQELEHVPMQLQSGETEYPFLSMVLAPSQRGVCELIVHWGKETGRVVFHKPA